MPRWCDAAKQLTLCFNMRAHPTDQLPTLLVLAPDEPIGETSFANPSCSTSRDTAIDHFDSLYDTLQKGLHSRLPMLLACGPRVAKSARKVLPGDSIIEIGRANTADSEFLVELLVSGVLASAHASGWIVIPTNLPMLRADTLLQIALAPTTHTLTVPEHRQRRGLPIRFAPELFSELIGLKNQRALRRLIASYPAAGIDVDDPGILMGDSSTLVSFFGDTELAHTLSLR